MQCKVTRSLCGNYWKVDVEREPGTVLFSGGDDERRALEYARWKEGVTVGISIDVPVTSSVAVFKVCSPGAPDGSPRPESWHDRPPML